MAIRRQVLRDEVEELILQRLLENRWAPGSRLSIDGLARDLEVSPTPVREAMVSLERSGLVEYVALRGYVVAPMLDDGQMVELLDARRTVESAALGKSFEEWEPLLADLEAAHTHHAEVLARIESDGQIDYDLINEHFQADWAFHQVFFNHARNRYLLTMVENLRTHTHRMRQTWSGGSVSFDGREAHEEHSRILQMVRQHNHDGALRALAEHLDLVLGRSLQGPTGDGEGAEAEKREPEAAAAEA
ncbi:GntR family transcriptional regulator [Brachybacterium sp. J153]|uniref:GntR family transcriptional regulator n=1 Tax=Brachybacterium sp. J153 TaxID=3116488 RepID=UPI002E77D73B|nr:GntR family transcriptional regulator [Brachybacterium sp. J153]MEE1618605.1 GntR family transcriptional regulator [Brachybacterium sp. J153]